MGWLSSRQWATKQDMVDHICSNFKLVDHSVRGGVLYGVYPANVISDHDFGIVICLIENLARKGRPPEWGYKDMGEGDYPYYFDCPERILAKSTLPDTSGWRKFCRELRAANKDNFKPREGLTVKSNREVLPDWCRGERVYNIRKVTQIGSKRGYWVFTAVDNHKVSYRLTRQLQLNMKFEEVQNELVS